MLFILCFAKECLDLCKTCFVLCSEREIYSECLRKRLLYRRFKIGLSGCDHVSLGEKIKPFQSNEVPHPICTQDVE